MINLLPYENKQIIRAGRANNLLVRYVLLTLSALVLLVIVLVFSWVLLNGIKNTAQAEIDQSNISGLQLSDELKQIESFEQNLATAKDILDSEINYSAILLRYAAVIPKGTIIDQIVLDPSIVGTPSSFTAKAKTSSDVLELKRALSESEYFDDVYFTQIARISDPASGYRYSVQISLTVNESLLEAGDTSL